MNNDQLYDCAILFEKCKRYDMAIEMHKYLISLGHNKSQLGLARLYNDVFNNIHKSLYWYQKSAINGNEFSIKYLDDYVKNSSKSNRRLNQLKVSQAYARVKNEI